jgi:hypothetical protein
MSRLSSQFAGCDEFLRCKGLLTRRRLLQAGAVGALGLGLSDLLKVRAGSLDQDLPPGAGKAKACIFLFMWGGPSQLDTFDLKPRAPAEVRGEFQPIATSVPGVQICEHFQRLARHVDKLAIIRSLNHTDPAHLSSGHATLTGHLAPEINSDAAPPSDRDTPHLGSTVSRVRAAHGSLPSFVTLPWFAYHPAAPGGQAPGQNGGWLGRRYDPMLLSGDPADPSWSVSELNLADGVTGNRLNLRNELLTSVDAQRRAMLDAAAASDLNDWQQRALAMLGSPQARSAFDLAAEPAHIRDRYGRNTHGQCVLLARRLVERGVSLVCVNWHNDGRNFWDTHGNNFNRLKQDLIPPADQALTALLEDLQQRGMLDETIVAWVGEFGRRPQISTGSAGREHWPFCYSGLLAGGGIRGGAVYGSSDSQASRPASNPVSPRDYAATILAALGISPELALMDRLGRPLRVCDGKPIAELFG